MEDESVLAVPTHYDINQLRFLSYNVGLLPNFKILGSVSGGANDERLRQIGDFVLGNLHYAHSTCARNGCKREHAAYDVVILQEMFGLTNWKTLDRFRRRMRVGGYPYILTYDDVGAQRDIRTDSGLTVLSRHPIVDWYFEEFEDVKLLSGDKLAQKGIVGVLIHIRETDTYGWIFNTHMQSDAMKAEENADVRDLQLQQIYRFVQRCKMESTCRIDFCLLGGDLNIARGEYEYENLSGIFSNMIDAYARFVPQSTLKNKTIEDRHRDGTEFRTPLTRKYGPRSIDYWLLSRDSQFRVRSVRIIDLRACDQDAKEKLECAHNRFGVYLSDHAAIELEVQIKI